MIQQFLGQLFGQAAQHAARHGGLEDPEVRRGLQVLGNIQQHLYGRWLQARSTRVACSIRLNHPQHGVLRCAESMAGLCTACDNPVCIEHAAVVVATGDPVCFACIDLARAAVTERGHAVPPGSSTGAADEIDAKQRTKLRRKYLRRLGLKANADQAQINAAFKKKAAAAHPDKAAPGPARDRAHERFVELGRAREWLLEDLEKREAA